MVLVVVGMDGDETCWGLRLRTVRTQLKKHVIIMLPWYRIWTRSNKSVKRQIPRKNIINPFSAKDELTRFGP